MSYGKQFLFVEERQVLNTEEAYSVYLNMDTYKIHLKLIFRTVTSLIYATESIKHFREYKKNFKNYYMKFGVYRIFAMDEIQLFFSMRVLMIHS